MAFAFDTDTLMDVSLVPCLLFKAVNFALSFSICCNVLEQMRHQETVAGATYGSFILPPGPETLFIDMWVCQKLNPAVAVPTIVGQLCSCCLPDCK